jgi:ParB-like chromosome segregation protein Spo0J
MPEYEIHPAADCFPMMSETELEALAKDIRANGLKHPVLRWGIRGPVIDGRNRIKACEMAGVDLWIEHVNPKEVGSPVDYVTSMNLLRRQLTTSQRGIIAARLANLPRGGDGSNQHKRANAPDGATHVSQSRAAELMGVGRRTAQRGEVVDSGGAPAVVAAVESGELSLTTAEHIVRDNPKDHAAQVKAMTEPAKKPPAKPSTPPDASERTRPKMGVQLARVAMKRLQEVQKRDELRRDGWRLVINWIAKQHGGPATIYSIADELRKKESK